MHKENIIQIPFEIELVRSVKGTNELEQNGKQAKQLMECKKLTSYASMELKVIYNDIKGDKCYKLLKPGVCNKVRNLWLNGRGKRGGKHLKLSLKQMGVNHDNLTIINNINEYTKSRSNHCIKGCLVNIQSLKNKDLTLRDHLTANQMDICVATETWLKNNDADAIWLEVSVLNNEGYKLDAANRNERKGGLALIHHSKVKKKIHRIMKSFENCIWKVTAKESTITLVVIYRPPYSNKNQITIHVFLDKFTEWMTNLIANEQNILLVGDFNIHVNDGCDITSKSFRETIDGWDYNNTLTSQHTDRATTWN